MQYITSSEKQTFNLAKNLTKQFKGGEVIGLIGQLGAGKTVFVKGIAAGLAIKKNITSPTFVLMKVYKIRNQKSRQSGKQAGIKNLVHIDAYRIKSPQDIVAIGAAEYFNRPDTITIIEWADKIKKILPKKIKYIKIKNQGGNTRKLTIVKLLLNNQLI